MENLNVTRQYVSLHNVAQIKQINIHFGRITIGQLVNELEFKHSIYTS